MRTGLHVNDIQDRARLLDYYRRSGAKVVKFFEFDNAVMDELKAMGVTIIGRLRIDGHDAGLGGEKARNFEKRLKRALNEHPMVDYWESYNESFQAGKELERYAEFEIDRMEMLEERGRRAVIGNFSTGQPELGEWKRFRPALEHARNHGHALGLHEYASPFMQWGCGRNQWDKEKNKAVTWDDPCTSPTVEGILTLRYRKVYQILREWGIGDLGLFITEGGIDDINPRPGGNLGNGYKNFMVPDTHPDYAGINWSQLPGIGDYADQRFWYMWQVSHDPFVRGIVDYGWDAEDIRWTAFNLATDPAMVNRIIDREQALPVGHFTSPQVFPDLPAGGPGGGPSSGGAGTPGGEPGGGSTPGGTPPESAVRPMLVVRAGWGWREVASHAYPDQIDDARIQVNAQAIAAANHVPADAPPHEGLALVVPGYRVTRD